MPKGFEWIIILIIVIIIFGPKALPKLGETLGTTVKNIRKGMSDDDEESEESDSKDSESEIVVSEEDQEIAELEAKLAEAKAKKAANEDDENESPVSTK